MSLILCGVVLSCTSTKRDFSTSSGGSAAGGAGAARTSGGAGGQGNRGGIAGTGGHGGRSNGAAGTSLGSDGGSDGGADGGSAGDNDAENGGSPGDAGSNGTGGTTGECVGGTCAATRKVGDACTSASECPNGYCVDGYCCDAKCDGECQACDQSPHGQCTTVTTPRTSCAGSGICGKKYCDGTHASCVFPGSETACPEQCSSDLSSVMSASCDGMGSCGAATAQACGSTQYCDASNSACVSKITSSSTACTEDIQCASGKCCNTCVDANTDDDNCGACGNECGANRSCRGGSCACSGYTFPASCGSTCGSWSFESDTSQTEGWSMMLPPQRSIAGDNAALNAAISAKRPAGYPGTGSTSLVVPLNANGITTSLASVGVQFCQPGKFTSVGGYTLSGYVYFDGPAFPSFAVFAADTWGANSSEASSTVILLNDQVVPKKWIRFETQMSFGFQYDHLAMTLGPNGAWSGTMYLDDLRFTGL